jgi:RNA polymerase sigma-70 factor, ECF subfamily
MRDDGPRLGSGMDNVSLQYRGADAPGDAGLAPAARKGLPQEVVDRACQGDKDAQDTVFREYEAPLSRFARARLPAYARGMTDTQDVVQDVFTNTARNLPRLDVREDGALLSYLRRAVQHRIVDEIRRATRRPVPEVLSEECPAPDLSPLERAIRAQNDRRVREALGELSPRDRMVVVLRLKHHSYEEIGARIGAPTPNAARVAVRRAVVRLTEVLEAAAGAPGAPPRAPVGARPKA